MDPSTDSRTYITSLGTYHCNVLAEGVSDPTVDKSSVEKYIGVEEVCEVSMHGYSGKFTPKDILPVISSELGRSMTDRDDSPLQCRGYCRILKGNEVVEGNITSYQMNPQSETIGGMQVVLYGGAGRMVLYVESESSGQRSFLMDDEMKGYIHVNGSLVLSTTEYNSFIARNNVMYVQNIEEYYREG